MSLVQTPLVSICCGLLYNKSTTNWNKWSLSYSTHANTSHKQLATAAVSKRMNNGNRYCYYYYYLVIYILVICFYNIFKHISWNSTLSDIHIAAAVHKQCTIQAQDSIGYSLIEWSQCNTYTNVYDLAMWRFKHPTCHNFKLVKYYIRVLVPCVRIDEVMVIMINDIWERWHQH